MAASGARALDVMHVVSVFEPGGMELGVLKLVNALDPARIRSAVCSTRPSKGMAPLLAPHVPLYELSRKDGNDPSLVWKLYHLFRRERPHVVHTHAWGTLVEGLVAARLARVPIVVHGEHGTLQLRRHQRLCQRLVWSRTDRVLSVSSRLSERMAREVKFPPHRIQTIRNGVDLSRFGRTGRAAARRALGLPPDALVIGAVGRVVPVKDHASLVEAVALLGRDGLRPIVVIAGGGPLRAAIFGRASALGLHGQVRLLGHRSDVDVVLDALDIFALPSRSEGLNNTLLEAMAARLPVVATRVGGADEIVVEGETGFLVAPGAPQDLASALARLIADPARRMAMGEAGRARVEAEFDLNDTIRRYERLYTDLARERRGLPVPAPALDPAPGSPEPIV